MAATYLRDDLVHVHLAGQSWTCPAGMFGCPVTSLCASQECRALRFLQSRPGGAPCVVRLHDSFSLGGHQCLALERLRPSLLGLIAESAELDRREALRQLRAAAFQLLVRWRRA